MKISTHASLMCMAITAVLPITAFSADKALLIGVAEYKMDAAVVSPLPGTQNDLIAMQRLLEQGFSVDHSDIQVLRNEQATHKGILGAIDNWLIKGTQPGDRVFLYYSGHGSYVPDQNGDEKDAAGGDGFDETLVPYDVVCSEGSACQNMVLDDELAARLNQLSDRFVFSMFDSCHSGTVTRELGVGKAKGVTEKLFRPEVALALQAEQSASNTQTRSTANKGATPHMATRGTVISHKNENGLVDAIGQHVNLFAVQSFQLALEVAGPDNKPRGLFTTQVVNALLNKAADFNTDGEVSFGELIRYTTEQSQAHCQKRGQACGAGLSPLIELPAALIGQNTLHYGKHTAESQNNENLESDDISAILSQSNDANLIVSIEPGNVLSVGDLMRISVSSERAGMLFLFDKDAAGQLTPLYPDNTLQDTRPDGLPIGWIQAGGSVLIPDTLANWEYEVVPPSGEGELIVVLAENYKAPPPVSRAFTPVPRQRESLGELRIALDELVDISGNGIIRESPQWSMTTVSYQVK